MTGSEQSDPVYEAITVFASRLAERGVTHVVVSPGSRSTPLTLCLDAQSGLTTWIRHDERSAGFFALGLGRATGRPAVLVCTSGTAAANYLPAVVEAYHAGVPLIACTADRPPELRGWGSPQTIDQVGLYGTATLLAADLPAASEMTTAEAESWADRAVDAATGVSLGPVHLNWPLREPLEPLHGIPRLGSVSPVVPPSRSAYPHGQPGGTSGDGRRRSRSQPAGVSGGGRGSHGQPGGVSGGSRRPHSQPGDEYGELSDALSALHEMVVSYKRGVVVAGPWPGGGREQEQLWAAETLRFASWAGWPVIAEPISGVRSSLSTANTPDAYVVATSDHLLADEAFGDRMRPDVVVLAGRTVTTKPVRLWLERTRPIHVVQIDPENRWKQAAFRLTASVPAQVKSLAELVTDTDTDASTPTRDLPGGRFATSRGVGRDLVADMAGRDGTVDRFATSRGIGRDLVVGTGRRDGTVDRFATSRGVGRDLVVGTGRRDGTGGWLDLWRTADLAARRALDDTIAEGPMLSALASRTLADALPSNSVLMLSNSMPVRDFDAFVCDTGSVWCVGNRGASGIDGIVSTALGLAADDVDRAVALYTGDLALLHDLASLTAAAQLGLHVTVVCIDNNGGEIFSLLPIAKRIGSDDFHRLFHTPHDICFHDLDGFGGIRTHRVTRADELAVKISTVTSTGDVGVDLIVVPVSAAADVAQRRALTTAAQTAAHAALEAL